MAAQRLRPVVPLMPRQSTAPVTRRTPGRPGVPANLGLLQRVVDALRDGIALVDEAGILMLVNRRVEEIFGYEHAGLPGLPLDTLIPAGRPDGLASELADGSLLAGRRKDDTVIAVQVSFTAVPAASGRLTLAVIRTAEVLPFGEQPGSAGGARLRELVPLARAAAGRPAEG